MTVDADGVIYFRVQNPILAVTNTTEAVMATQLLAETTFKNVLGTKNLSEIISNREQIAHTIQVWLSCGSQPGARQGLHWSTPPPARQVPQTLSFSF